MTEHSDHSKSAKGLAKRGIDIYMSKGTHEALNLPDSYYYHFVEANKMITIGLYQVFPFDVHHDHETQPCKEPLGFMIIDTETDERLLYITDTSHVDYNFSKQGITHYMIECNHSAELLEESVNEGIIPASLGERIRHTHFSLKQVVKFFKANNLTKCKEIHLIHISKQNGDPKLFQETIQGLTGLPVYV